MTPGLSELTTVIKLRISALPEPMKRPALALPLGRAVIRMNVSVSKVTYLGSRCVVGAIGSLHLNLLALMEVDPFVEAFGEVGRVEVGQRDKIQSGTS